MERTATDAARRATRRQGLALFLAVTVLFVILYFPCLFQGRMYGYHDIGRDTKNQYLPNMVYALRSIKAGEPDVYKLDRGLGEYYPSLLYKYVNGVNLPLLLFGEAHLAWGLLAATYLKYLVIALCAWLFFRRLLGRDLIPLCCALLWTYCSYSVVWGQHYHLLTSICAFTVELCGLQLFLESDRKAFLLIPAVACMAYTGYFYLWMGTFFVLGYSLCYLIFRGEKPLEILKKALLCILCFVWACLIAGEYMLPGVQEFIESTRGGGIANSNKAGGLFYGINYLYAFLGRLLSTNLLGVGNAYRGPTNYYEIAFAGTGIIFIFALSVLLLDQKTRARTAGLLVICALLTCSPMASKLFSMRATTQRWSFILELAEIIGIGFGLKRLLGTKDTTAFRKVALKALMLTDVLCCSIATALWFGQTQANVEVDRNALVVFFVLLMAYNVLLIGASEFLPAWSFSPRDFRRLVSAAVTLMVCVEIVVTAYPAINDRQMIRRDEWKNDMYYDGTEKMAQRIGEKDDGLYRIGKAYESVSRNDEMVQGFNGAAVYNSLNAHWLVNYYVQMGYSISNTDAATGSNYIRFACNDEIETGLLGIRYLLKKNGKKLPNIQGFSEFLGDEDSQIFSFKNELVTSFGYLYENPLDYDEINRYGLDYIKAQLTRGYFETVDLLAPKTEEDGEEDDLEIIPVNDPDTGYYTRELMNGPVHGSICTLEDLELPASNRVLKAIVTINSPTEGSANMDIFTGKNPKIRRAYNTYSQNIMLSAGRKRYAVAVDRCDVHTIEFSLDADAWLESVVLEYEDREVLVQNIERLYNNGRVDLAQRGNTIGGTVENPDTRTKMLCVPLIYNQRWRARLDGVDVQAQNINGGLIGLEIGPGQHTVELTYRDDTPRLGRMVGAISFGLYLVFLAVWFAVARRKRTAVAPLSRGGSEKRHANGIGSRRQDAMEDEYDQL